MATSPLSLPPFTVTRAAINEISARGGAVLLDLEEGGCCGTTYAFPLPEDLDSVPAGTVRYGCEGAWLLVSPRAAAMLDGATLDHRARTRPPRFAVLRNPNTPEVCPVPALLRRRLAGSRPARLPRVPAHVLGRRVRSADRLAAPDRLATVAMRGSTHGDDCS